MSSKQYNDHLDDIEYFKPSTDRLKAIVDSEIKAFEKLSKTNKEYRLSTYKSDINNLSKLPTYTVLNAANITRMNILKDNDYTYLNEFFGPVGLRWDDETNHTQIITAVSESFPTKQERNEFLTQERPLIYSLVVSTRLKYTEEEKNNFTFPHDENREKETKYIVRYFPEVGRLSKFKYKAQFWIAKWNFKWFRPSLYRYLVDK